MENDRTRSTAWSNAERAAVLMAGVSTPIREVARALARLAGADVNLLLYGEPGTGKHVLAEMIHVQSPRGSMPFVTAVVGRRSETQLEQELFAEGGGAVARASGSTLYLEGIGALSLRLQRRLLRAFRNGDGAAAVRVIASTTTELEELVRIGRLLPELYFQLGLVRLVIPPLRERREDIAAIVEQYLRCSCARAGVRRLALGRAAVGELVNHTWPGNLHELAQTLDAALTQARGGEVSAERIRGLLGRRPDRFSGSDVFPLRELERDYIANVLARCNWNQSLAARRLGIGRNTLMRKIRTFKLERSEAA